MKQNILKRLICLVLICCLSISAFAGCKRKPAENNSSMLSSEQSYEQESTNEETEETESEDFVEYEDGTSFEEEPFEEEPLENDFVSSDVLTDSEDDDTFKEIINIHNNEIINDNFRGVNYVYQLYNRMPDSLGRKYTQKQIQYEIDTIDKMGMNMIRSFYGSSIAWDPKEQRHDYDNEYMKAFYQSCNDMEKIGVDIGITMAWDLKGFFQEKVSHKQTVDLYLNGYVVPGDYDATMRNFKTFVEESVRAFRSHGVNNIKYIYAFTECNNLYGNTIDTRNYDEVIPLYEKALIALDEGLKSSGLRKQYKIVAPCDNWRNDPEYSRLVRYTLEHLSDRADIIGSHNGYARSNDYIDDFFYDYAWDKPGVTMQEAQAAGKEFWVDETNVSLQEDLSNTPKEKRLNNKNKMRGVALGATINGMMNTGGISNLLLWSLSNQQWPDSITNNAEFDNGVQALGFLPNLMESTVPTAAWYSAAMLTKYIGQGKVYGVTDDFGLYASAIERNDGEITVVVTNYNYTETVFDLFFDESLGGKTFYRYLYDSNNITPVPGNEMLKPDSVAKQVTTGFSDEVPGMSVAVYTTVKDQQVI